MTRLGGRMRWIRRLRFRGSNLGWVEGAARMGQEVFAELVFDHDVVCNVIHLCMQIQVRCLDCQAILGQIGN